jgi:hypothetical protein
VCYFGLRLLSVGITGLHYHIQLESNFLDSICGEDSEVKEKNTGRREILRRLLLLLVLTRFELRASSGLGRDFIT